MDRKNRLSSWQMGHIVSEEWTREKEKHWWLETWVYFYWKESFLSQKITKSGNVTADFSSQLHWWKSSVFLGTLWCTESYAGWPLSFQVREDSSHLTSCFGRANTVREKAGAVLISVRKQRGCSCGWWLFKQHSMEEEYENSPSIINIAFLY